MGETDKRRSNLLREYHELVTLADRKGVYYEPPDGSPVEWPTSDISDEVRVLRFLVRTPSE